MPRARRPPIQLQKSMSLAKLFARPHYTSAATDFIQSLKQQRPELEQSQRQPARRARAADRLRLLRVFAQARRTPERARRRMSA